MNELFNDYDLYDCINYLEEHRVISLTNADDLRKDLDDLFLIATSMKQIKELFEEIDEEVNMDEN